MRKKPAQPLSATLEKFAAFSLAEYEVGQEVKADLFAEGEFVDVTGISKGKGFQGVHQTLEPKHEVQWLTVRVITVDQVPWVRSKRTVFLKAKAFQDTWVHETVTIQNLKSSE